MGVGGRLLAGIAVALIVAVGGYWYWSPHVAVYRMARAADAGDAQTFNEHVDYARLRESVKAQMSARLAAQMADVGGSASHNPLAQAGAALGVLLGTAAIDASVDAMVRPQVVMYAMRHDGHLDPKAASAHAASTPASGAAPPSARREAGYAIDRTGLDTVLVYPGEGDLAKAKAEHRPALVFERTGFANWALVGVRLGQQ